MLLNSIAWDSLCISPTLLTDRTECCVLGTPATPGAQYLILYTSTVLTTGDTSSTTTPGLIPRILMGILVTLVMIYVKLKFTVRVLHVHIDTLGNKRCEIRFKKSRTYFRPIFSNAFFFFFIHHPT